MNALKLSMSIFIALSFFCALKSMEVDATDAQPIEQPKPKKGSRIAVRNLELSAVALAEMAQDEQPLVNLHARASFSQNDYDRCLAELARYKKVVDIDDTRNGLNEFHRAARYGNLEEVRALIKKADIDAQTAEELTALHIACSYGYDDIVALLLEHKASTTAVTTAGLTPLHVATEGGCFSVVARLLLSGASANCIHSSLGLPLHLAATKGHFDILELLLESTDQVDTLDGAGWPALAYAALNGHTDCALKLLEKGASKKTIVGALTCEQWAQAKGHAATAHAISLFNDNQRTSQSSVLTTSLRASFDGSLPVENSDLALGITTSYDGVKRNNASPVQLTPRSREATPLSGRSPRSGAGTPTATPRALTRASVDNLRLSSASPGLMSAAPGSPRPGLRNQLSSPRIGSFSTGNSPRSPKGANPDTWERRKSTSPAAPAPSTLTKRRTIHQFLTTEKLPKDATDIERAVVAGAPAITQYLIKALKESDKPLNLTDSKGYGLIHYAVLHQQLTELNYLLDEGADSNLATRDGLTPLMIAAQKEFYAGMSALIKKGACVQATQDSKPWYQHLPKAIECTFIHELIQALIKK